MADNPIPDSLRETMNALALTLDEILNEKTEERVGFSLLVFDFGEDGTMSYISNAAREDMIKAMEEFLEKQRGAGTS